VRPARIPIRGERLQPELGAPSPDGRWIALENADSPTRSSLWLLPAAGGQAVRLTGDGYTDGAPAWHPAGDRIYFVSNRPSRGDRSRYLMVLRIDPQTGRPAGQPRQVSVEAGADIPVPAPDGRSVAYRVEHEIRVVPAAGGNSRLVLKAAQVPARLAWEPDGSAIYYAHLDRPRGQILFRVPAAGGQPTEVTRLGGRQIGPIAPDIRRVATWRSVSGPRDRAVEVLDFDGNVVARALMPTAVRPNAFAADGRSLILSSVDFGAIIRAQPVAGGPARDLTPPGEYDWVGGWTADGRAVITQQTGQDGLSLAILPLDGGPSRVIQVDAPPEARWRSTMPSHSLHGTPLGDGRGLRLVAVEMATGRETVVNEGGGFPTALTGPAGLYRGQDGFHYGERDGDRTIYSLWRPDGTRRVIFSLPALEVPRTAIAWAGERVAFTKLVGDSMGVMYVPTPGAEPRLIATLGVPPTPEACCRLSLGFSPDGSLLVAQPADDPMAATVIRVPARGRATDVRTRRMDAEYWYEPHWLPDGSAFTAILGSANHAWIAVLPADPAAPIRHLSRDDRYPAWGHELSPDGRLVAYPAEVRRGSTLWRMPVPNAR